VTGGPLRTINSTFDGELTGNSTIVNKFLSTGLSSSNLTQTPNSSATTVCVLCSTIDPHCGVCSSFSKGARCDACAFGYYFDQNHICQKCLFEFGNCEVCSLGPDFNAYCQVCLPNYTPSSGECIQLFPLAAGRLTFITMAAVLIATLLLPMF